VDKKVYGFKKIKTLKKNAIVTVVLSVTAIQRFADVVVTKKRRVNNEKEN